MTAAVAGVVVGALSACSATPGGGSGAGRQVSASPTRPACFTVAEFNAALKKAGSSTAIPRNSTVTCDSGYQLANVGYSDGDSMWFAVWSADGVPRYGRYNYFGEEGCQAPLPQSLVTEMCPGGPASPVG